MTTLQSYMPWIIPYSLNTLLFPSSAVWNNFSNSSYAAALHFQFLLTSLSERGPVGGASSTPSDMAHRRGIPSRREEQPRVACEIFENGRVGGNSNFHIGKAREKLLKIFWSGISKLQNLVSRCHNQITIYWIQNIFYSSTCFSQFYWM